MLENIFNLLSNLPLQEPSQKLPEKEKAGNHAKPQLCTQVQSTSAGASAPPDTTIFVQLLGKGMKTDMNEIQKTWALHSPLVKRIEYYFVKRHPEIQTDSFLLRSSLFSSKWNCDSNS